MSIIKTIQDILYSFGLIVKRVRPENNSWLTNRNINTVLDVGANTGQFAQRIHKIIPQASIISFEPIPSCYQQLVQNTTHMPVRAFNFALGDKTEQLEMNISQHSPSSSVLEMADLHKEAFAGTDFLKKETISVRTLDEVAPELGELGKFIIKIDVQGFEDKVIKGGAETIKKAELIVIETSFRELYKGQMLFGGIYNLLIDLGFIFMGNVTQAPNPEDGSILYAESLFINTRK